MTGRGAAGSSLVTPGDVTVDRFDFDAAGGTPVIITSAPPIRPTSTESPTAARSSA